ncbi:hypothetical protein SAMN03097699_1146 [Flavobacteriaceae bacterium MAR_2010_188]|nr:hypothetical protein SAMN03097699_1146 [Flavobacteriaceae bacterium MAR_2010_188]
MIIVCLAVIVVNLFMTDFDNFWELTTLFRFSMPLLTIVVVLLFIRKKRIKLRNAKDKE